MEEEIFKDVVGFEGHYIVSNYGKVISVKFGKKKEIKPFLWANGRYYYFHTCKVGVHGQLSVARAVAQAFPEICGEWFEGCTVDHINTITTDNRAENLRVVSLKDNINNHLTLAKMKKFSDEEMEVKKKQWKHEDYIKHKDYYKNYYKNHYQNNKEYYKEYYKKHPLTEEQKEKNRQRARKYYYDHKEEIAAKNKKPKTGFEDVLKKGGLI